MKDFEVQIAFGLSDRDKGLYDKYGVPAVEFANDGEYLPAIKLMDKVLSQSPNAEFALVLKANYLSNHIGDTLSFGESRGDVEATEEKTRKAKDNYTECIVLLTKAIKINPKNKGAKDLKKHIQSTSLKAIEDLLKTISKTKKDVAKRGNKGLEVNLICPYCEAQNIHEIKKSLEEYECPKCHKVFRSFVGEVRGVRGLGGYVAHEVVIRLKKIEGGEDIISYFSSYQGIELRSGDMIAIEYKKGLFGGYGNKPHLITNFSIGRSFSKI